MSLSPISAIASQVLSIFTHSKSTSATTANTAGSTSSNAASSSVDISDAAQFFNKLQNLSQTDPSKFKQLTAQISSQLQTAAGNSTGKEATFLSNLSDKFKTASQTGDASALEPSQAQQAGGHHHHAHGNHASYSASNATDPNSTGSVLQSIFAEVQAA